VGDYFEVIDFREEARACDSTAFDLSVSKPEKGLSVESKPVM
jgi:hypothetical protein